MIDPSRGLHIVTSAATERWDRARGSRSAPRAAEDVDGEDDVRRKGTFDGRRSGPGRRARHRGIARLRRQTLAADFSPVDDRTLLGGGRGGTTTSCHSLSLTLLLALSLAPSPRCRRRLRRETLIRDQDCQRSGIVFRFDISFSCGSALRAIFGSVI